ncbi:MAG: DUF4179 domain-containing protein [Clostridia bacterium]|nr:DUF4179 domain-containing protein [Clostridia bacterium]
MKKWLSKSALALLGLVCALVICAVFYAAMVYQIPGEDGAQAQQEGGLLALADAEMTQEQTQTVSFGGKTCTAVVRRYVFSDGRQAEAITAQPAAYMERIAQEGWTPQLITGFVLAGMDAVYALRGEECLLAARQGDRVYMLRAQAGEQQAYALGAGAYLDEISWPSAP